MPKVNKYIFSEIQMVLHQMPCSETFCVGRLFINQRIQCALRMTQLNEMKNLKALQRSGSEVYIPSSVRNVPLGFIIWVWSWWERLTMRDPGGMGKRQQRKPNMIWIYHVLHQALVHLRIVFLPRCCTCCIRTAVEAARRAAFRWLCVIVPPTGRP